jgi:hypothetical protein
MPIDMKSDMMKNMPEGMAGACQVTWEKDEEDEDEEHNQDEMRMKNMMKKLTLKVIKMTMIV